MLIFGAFKAQRTDQGILFRPEYQAAIQLDVLCFLCSRHSSLEQYKRYLCT